MRSFDIRLDGVTFGYHEKEVLHGIHMEIQEGTVNALVGPSGSPDASDEEVVEAAKKCGCHEFIMALPDGYETIIGEGGASLSGGEKQRISIARAIMKNAPIIILDEATANVDPESERELTQAIEELTKEKTILMIAHRLKTVRHADNILVIDGGCVVQSGTHEKLMQTDGIYRRFVESREYAIGWKV